MLKLLLKCLKNHTKTFYPFFQVQFLSFFKKNSKIDSSDGGISDSSLLKSQLYFSTKSITEITDEADHLFDRGQFLEVYELLNRLKFNNNAEVQWRICRALFKMSTDQIVPNEIRKEMILEAYQLMTATLDLEKNNANVYKWMAIILDSKSGMDGLDIRVKNYTSVRNYLEKAVELNPEDPVTLYILGKWHYEMSNLSLLQRWIAKIFYWSIPETSFEEAYEYLLKSDEAHQDNYYIPTLFLLGSTCLKLGQMFRARYYLKTAATLPARTKFETECAQAARQLLKKIDFFNLEKADENFEKFIYL